MAQDPVRVESLGKVGILGEKLDERKRIALVRIGALLVIRAQTAFDEQKRGDFEWPERGVPNVAGIVEDCERGGSIKERRFQERPAGIDTGRLRSSVAWEIVDESSVRVGVNLDYGSLIQFGGLVEIDVTQNTIDCILAYAKDHPERFDKTLRALVKKGPHTFTINVPARPFIAVTDDDLDDIRSIAGDLDL